MRIQVKPYMLLFYKFDWRSSIILLYFMDKTCIIMESVIKACTVYMYCKQSLTELVYLALLDIMIKSRITAEKALYIPHN